MYIPRYCPCSKYVVRLHDRLDHALEKVMANVEEIKGRDLRLEVRRI
jgi:hypothetical protein